MRKDVHLLQLLLLGLVRLDSEDEPQCNARNQGAGADAIVAAYRQTVLTVLQAVAQLLKNRL